VVKIYVRVHEIRVQAFWWLLFFQVLAHAFAFRETPTGI